METLVRDTQQAEDAPHAAGGADGAVPPGEGASGGSQPGDGAAAPAPGAVACQACGATLAPEQDWCLACGTARPGRLGGRPGWRTAGAISGLTLLLVTGAVAASYAALTDDANREAGKPAPASATPVAQTPPPAATPPAATPPAATPPATSTPPASSTPAAPSTPSGSSKLPSLPKLPAPTAVPTPPASSTPSASASPPASSTPSSTPSAPSTGSTDKGSSDTGSKTTPGKPTAIALDASAASLYDPYSRATASGPAGNAIAADAKDAWFVTAPADGKDMQVGLLVKLGSPQTVRAIELATETPGFRLEVYGADGSEVPPDILDTRWTHVASRSKVDENSAGSNKSGDGKERIDLRGDGERFREVVLWFTTPPDGGTTVRLRDLKILG